jgi:hypothetical protein
VTGDAALGEEAMRAYRWYLGANDLELPLASPQDGGCFDGLMPHGLEPQSGRRVDSGAAIGELRHFRFSKPAENVAGPERAVA